jgi:hypothetical protein
MSDNPLNVLQEAEASKPLEKQTIPVPQRGRVKADKQAPGIPSKKDVSKAAKSGYRRNGKWNKVFRLPVEWEDLIKQIYAETPARSVAEIERWLVGRGLRAYFEDGEKPDFRESIERQVVLPYTKQGD